MTTEPPGTEPGVPQSPLTGPPPTPVEPGIVADPASPARPFGIVMLGLMVLALAVQSLLVAFGITETRAGSIGALLADPTQARAYGAAFGVTALYAAVAIWFYWRPGWYVAVVIAGLSMLLQIVQYIWSNPNFLSLALAVVTAFYLNQREVKIRFLKPRREPTVATLTVPRDDTR